MRFHYNAGEEATDDFVNIIRPHSGKFEGVVHSFTGTEVQDRKNTNRTEPNRTEPNRTEPRSRFGSVRFG